MPENDGVKGKFVWYDLMTTDTAGAEAFYTAVVGWKAQDSGMPGIKYTMFSSKEGPMAGLMGMAPDAPGAPPMWLGHIGVADVDEYTRKMKAAGGAVRREPTDIPEVGRFSVVTDPQGAMVALFQPKAGATPPPEAPTGTPGHIGWAELHAVDGEAAFKFYTAMFGWTESGSVDMGSMGPYRMFAMGDAPAGGMMTKMANMPVPMWLFYFNVDSITAAEKRILAAGGKVVHGPAEVPGGMWIVSGFDPQGAMFAVVGPKS